MESLLCNEVWLMSPNNVDDDDVANGTTCSFVSTEEDYCEKAFASFLAKETRYLPQSGYLNLVRTHHFIADARFKAVTWIIKSQRRMDLCAETVFGAVNCLDRFISMTQCQGWKSWMFELLSISCLSIAAKFNETSAYPLHEFQEGLESSFAPNLIQRMELTLLKSLDWRVDSTTPFSYIYLLTQTSTDAFNKALVQQSTKSTTQLLLHLLLDPKFLEFRQCVVAISAVKTVVQDLIASREYPSFANLETLIPLDHKDDLIHCQRLIRKLLARDEIIYSCSSPSSPVTVLKVDLFHSFDFGTAATAAAPLSLKIDLRSSRKREREREEVGELGEGL